MTNTFFTPIKKYCEAHNCEFVSASYDTLRQAHKIVINRRGEEVAIFINDGDERSFFDILQQKLA